MNFTTIAKTLKANDPKSEADLLEIFDNDSWEAASSLDNDLADIRTDFIETANQYASKEVSSSAIDDEEDIEGAAPKEDEMEPSISYEKIMGSRAAQFATLFGVTNEEMQKEFNEILSTSFIEIDKLSEGLQKVVKALDI
jgi:hypothetical protein